MQRTRLLCVQRPCPATWGIIRRCVVSRGGHVGGTRGVCMACGTWRSRELEHCMCIALFGGIGVVDLACLRRDGWWHVPMHGCVGHAWQVVLQAGTKRGPRPCAVMWHQLAAARWPPMSAFICTWVHAGLPTPVLNDRCWAGYTQTTCGGVKADFATQHAVDSNTAECGLDLAFVCAAPPHAGVAAGWPAGRSQL